MHHLLALTTALFNFLMVTFAQWCHPERHHTCRASFTKKKKRWTERNFEGTGLNVEEVYSLDLWTERLIAKPAWKMWNEQQWMCQNVHANEAVVGKTKCSLHKHPPEGCGHEALWERLLVGWMLEHIAVLVRWIFFFFVCACVKAANAWLIINQYSASWDAGGCFRPGTFGTSATVNANSKLFAETVKPHAFKRFRSAV